MMHRDMDDRENELWKENKNSSKGKRGSWESWPGQPGAGTAGAELSLRLELEHCSQSCCAQCGEGLDQPMGSSCRGDRHCCQAVPSQLYLEVSMEVLGRLEPVSHGI